MAKNTEQQKLSEEIQAVENERELFLQKFVEFKQNLPEHSLMKQIDQWENDSINKIRQAAEECRREAIISLKKSFRRIDYQFAGITEQLKQIHNTQKCDELKQRLIELTEELNQPKYILIEENPTLFINKINLIDRSNTRWKEFGIDITAGNQLMNRSSILIDDQTIYIVDSDNDRIVKWRSNECPCETVAGGNGKGKEMNQLNSPRDMILDKEKNCFIISDYGNKRIVQWFRDKEQAERVIIAKIQCSGLALDRDGFLYTADDEKHEVRKWQIGDGNGKLVAGVNGRGSNLNQLNHPSSIFVDRDGSVYISDCANHRVMKWLKGARQGIIIAGGNGEGNSLKQLSGPQGILLDQLNQIYVVDHGNNRVMRWIEGAKKGSIVAGGNGYGHELNQLFYPTGLSFDHQGNLYVVDSVNNRIQKFEIDSN
ncbi:unnamed protein product [Adineta ricciae]|uniref:Uncharacterized protein n=1 Tax=Adineta ricciae TaxID=249248 RepID=A0A814WXV9_ADIRI|nr:unnamed protein product [Adineta ricciae]